MNFAQKLKELRAAAGMSQEKLAEKVGVSRQAITKWETDKGDPDLGNLMALSDLFGVSVDELLGRQSRKAADGYFYESVTEYDIADSKRFDIKLGGARYVEVTAVEAEKLRVRLVSNTIASLSSDCKVRIDDTRNRLDVEAQRLNGLSEAAAREGLCAFVELPKKYVRHVELSANVHTLRVKDLICEQLEVDGKVQHVTVEGFEGELEINSNLDMQVDCRALVGELALNQVSAVSRLYLPESVSFSVKKRGVGNSLYFEQAGRAAKDFSIPESPLAIELNGMKSELFICRE